MPVKTKQAYSSVPPLFYEGWKSWNPSVKTRIELPGETYLSSDETIIYENVGKSRMTNCIHETRSSKHLLTTGEHVDQDDPSGRHYGNYQLRWFRDEVKFHTVYTQGSPNSLAFHAFINRASRALVPSLSGAFDAPTFLLELPDLGRLTKPWFHQRDSLLKRAAKSHLNWSLGLAPFLSDVRRLYKALRDVMSRIERFKQLLNKPVVLHYAEASEFGLPAHHRVTGGSHLYHEVVYEWRTAPKWCATAKAVAYCAALDTCYADILAMLDAFGVNLNPRIIWERIPFSFVVDWFFDIGGRLDSYRLDNLDVTLVVLDMCVSHKYEYQWTQQSKMGPDEGPTPYFVGTCKRYERVRCQPDFSSLPISGATPTVPQILIGGSLYTANRH